MEEKSDATTTYELYRQEQRRQALEYEQILQNAELALRRKEKLADMGEELERLKEQLHKQLLQQEWKEKVEKKQGAVAEEFRIVYEALTPQEQWKQQLARVKKERRQQLIARVKKKIAATKALKQQTQKAGSMATEKTADASRLDEQMKQFKNVEIIRAGSTITLPVGMDLETGAEWLRRQAAAENQVIGVYEVIHGGHCLDAAHAFVKVLMHKYGWVNSTGTPTFFGSRPPTMMGVTVDAKGSTVQVPWGRFQIPTITGFLQTGTHTDDDGRMLFTIVGEVQAKYKNEVNEIAQATREYLRSHSIYKGMALEVTFPDPREEDASPFAHAPKFIDVSQINEHELIFNADVQHLLDISLWTILSHLDRVRRAQIPVKRGILLYGRYGVGKTLVALATAKKAVQNNITFVEVKRVDQVAKAIQFAQMHTPAVVFVEDIDRADERAQRTDAFNEILNTIDGITSKSEEIVTVMTTNFIERINKSLLRPGRLDSVVHIAEPDAQSVIRLVRLYARDMLSSTEDLTKVGMMLAGEIAAVVREVVERSKLAAIHRGSVDHITATDLELAAMGMRQHLDLLRETVEDTRSDRVKAASVLADAIRATVPTPTAVAAVAQLEEGEPTFTEAIRDKRVARELLGTASTD